MTYLVLNLEWDHVEAVTACAVLSELSKGHLSGPGHDAIVDPPLVRIDSGRKRFSAGLELFELACSGLLLFHQSRSAGLDFSQSLSVRLFLLLESLLQTLDLVQ